MSVSITAPADLTWSDELGAENSYASDFIGPKLPAVDVFGVNYLVSDWRDQAALAEQYAREMEDKGYPNAARTYRAEAWERRSAARALQHAAMFFC